MKCEICGHGIVEDDVLDVNLEYLEVMKKVCGHCTKCGCNYTWEEIYTFIGIENFEIQN